jgi:hypothetical protein
MYWQSILADHWIEQAVLKSVVADTFGLPSEGVDVVDDVTLLVGPVPPEPRILVERVRRDKHDGFPVQIDVFLGGDVVERQVADLAGTLDRARVLARQLGVMMLLGDGPIGNLEQLRVAPDGQVDIVQLDPDALDEDRFIIVGARPFTAAAADAASARAS